MRLKGDIFKADVHRAGQEWSRKLDTGIYWRRMLHHSVRLSQPELCWHSAVASGSLCEDSPAILLLMPLNGGRSGLLPLSV